MTLWETLQPFTLCSDQPHLLFYSFTFLFTGLVSTCQPRRNVLSTPSPAWSFSSLFAASLYFGFGRTYSPTRDKGFSWPQAAQEWKGNALPKKLNYAHFERCFPNSFLKHPCSQPHFWGMAPCISPGALEVQPCCSWHPKSTDLFILP